MKTLRKWFETIKIKAKAFKREVKVLYIAYKHPEVPWYAKAFMALVIGYALSPIDLIPDFIPVLGYLDDLILIPLGISLAIRMIPAHVLEESRAQADNVFRNGKPKNWAAGIIIILVWVLVVLIITFKLIYILK
jgi:uncharacterized membrane protein YkvA (DUF1232 family)